MQEEIVYLHPRSAFHLGERGIGLEETADFVHADTLHAALAVAWATLYGRERLEQEFLRPGDPPVLLSSALPFAGPVRFYPRPFLPLPPGMVDRQDMKSLRALKDVAYVSEGILRLHLEGRAYPMDTTLHRGRVLLLPEEEDALKTLLKRKSLEGVVFWATTRVPRVAVDVAGFHSNIWHFGRVTFHQHAGLFLWVRYRDERLADAFRAAMRLLGDMGIGGDRSSGHGLFDVTFDAASPLGNAQAERFITLAPLYPKREEIPDLVGEEARYRWITRRGWIGSMAATPYRRRTVTMFAEGSVLTGRADHVWGDLVDVTPLEVSPPLPHRVYRYGYAFPIGVPPWDK